MVSLLKEVVHGLLPSFPSSLILDKYISPNYMGLFLTEHQEDLLKKLAMSFVKEASHLCEYLAAVVALTFVPCFCHMTIIALIILSKHTSLCKCLELLSKHSMS